jgi:hypothetical protein
MADMNGATDHPPQLKKGLSRWRVALFLVFGGACIAFALIPTRVPTTAYTLAREQKVALFFPVYAFFFIVYVVWVVIELRKTLAWCQYRRSHPQQIRRLSVSGARGQGRPCSASHDACPAWAASRPIASHAPPISIPLKARGAGQN